MLRAQCTRFVSLKNFLMKPNKSGRVPMTPSFNWPHLISMLKPQYSMKKLAILLSPRTPSGLYTCGYCESLKLQLSRMQSRKGGKLPMMQHLKQILHSFKVHHSGTVKYFVELMKKSCLIQKVMRNWQKPHSVIRQYRYMLRLVIRMRRK